MIDTTLTYLDSYCERAGEAALWAEPLNAVTNLAFLVAALLVARQLWAGRAGAGRWADLWGLTCLLACIAVGSGAWHLFATHATMLADVIPITLFMNLYLLSALRRLLGLRWGALVGVWLGYQALTVAAQLTLPPDLFHGTVMYLPTYGVLLALVAAVWRRDVRQGRWMVGIAALWGLSLLARTVDLELCAWLPIGTHFLWHLFNAVVLWGLMQPLLGTKMPASQP